MNMSVESNFIERCLNEIELKESPFLVWGLVDSAFIKNDLADIIDPLLDEFIVAGNDFFYDSNQIIEELCIRGLLHHKIVDDQSFYRSRMAETIRLMSRLRQLFPNHEGGDGWRQSATLVSDYRFVLRPRSFPKRNIPLNTVLKEITKIPEIDNQKNILQNLLDRSQPMFLSGYQARGTFRILKSAISGKSTGTIICAGTGSGKTLSFYLPALTQIASYITNDAKNNKWVKAIAIYPRNELLKDQFSEIYKESRYLDTYFKENGLRKIQIGAFFGPTPNSAKSLTNKQIGWQRVADGFQCEYIRCPSKGCEGVLIWCDIDRENGVEQLICNSCHHKITDDEVLLTRKSIQNSPPDILFTSTEMLNQRMSDSWSRHLFGLGPKAKRSPQFMLLDEVHTYVGAHGAQVAYLIRRWKNIIRNNVTFVGLSATLKNASTFFSELIGLNDWQIEEISPHVDEMTKKGAEYLLALRGDPVSRKSLLSTTIQTIMLSARTLDPRNKSVSQGLFGSKVFVFSDDIDVTNRLYFNVLDAEGRDSFGNPDPAKPSGGLAVLRESSLNEIRYKYGQDWRFCNDLGHELSSRLRIGRTTSQDPGISLDRDVIVATGALEVGYNDPEVGTVIQHKAPRDVAQFLQRKGRAGRKIYMRPWTMVVLSDYGRDRITYQTYDSLFDPELSPRHLPITNRYILKMQAIYALIDFLGVRFQNFHSKGSIWQDLSGPDFKNSQYNTDRREAIVKEIETFFQSESYLEELRSFLINALDLRNTNNADGIVSALLWEYPRPLMTTVLPTALRRLKSNWAKEGIPTQDYHVPNSPLPEFIPSTLFSDLMLPEVKVTMPPQKKEDEEFIATMAIFQAMKDFAPGRVSKRFTILHKYVRHWIVPDNLVIDNSNQDIEIDQIGEYYGLGNFLVNDEEAIKQVPTYRLLELRPSAPTPSINDTSNAMLIWKTQIVSNNDPLKIKIPKNCGWENDFDSIEFFLHNNQNPIEVRRFAIGSSATISLKNSDPCQKQFRFTKEGESVALGMNMDVDGVLFKLKIPENLWEDLNGHKSKKWRALRTVRYFDRAWQGDALSTLPNQFTRDWLAQIYLSTITYEALKSNNSFENSAKNVREGTSELNLQDILEVIFQSNKIADDQNEGGDENNEDRLREELIFLLNQSNITNELEELAATCLWGKIDQSWQPWLKRHYTSTIAAGLFQSIENFCPNLDSEMLYVDIDHFREAYDDNIAEIWITEKTIGGCGVLEEFIISLGMDPKCFFGLLDSTFRPSEYELIDKQLIKILTLAQDSSKSIAQHFENIRSASSIHMDEALKNLFATLSDVGLMLFHSFISSLNNRVLRPGSNESTDLFLKKALEYWYEKESKLGIEIDVRIISFVLSYENDLSQLIDVVNKQSDIPNMDLWRFNTIYGLLWLRGKDIRQKHLSVYNPFHDFPKTERLLLIEKSKTHIQQISILENELEDKCSLILSKQGKICIFCPDGNRKQLKCLFNFLMTNPIEDDYLLLYPRITALRQNLDSIEIDFEIAEALQ
jgi:DEAD/DEAH box helicase/Helicase conserved C-terminal domain